MPLFAFIPYFPKQNFDKTINRVHFFNLSCSDTYIGDPDLRARINEYASLYVDAHNNQGSTFTLAVIDGKYDFGALNEQQQLDLSRYAVSLLFCNVVNNSENRVCVSEQFTLLFQPFEMPTKDAGQNNNYISYQTGSFYRVLNTYSLDSARFVRPGFVPDYNIFYLHDKKLMSGLANMIDNGDPKDDKYFRALDWVRYAHLNAEGFSAESRIVMLATAFEVFFELPRHGKTKNYVSALETLLAVDKMPVEDDNGQVIRVGLPGLAKQYVGHGGKTKTATHSIYGWWARDFYDLRSKIVHGDEIRNEDIKTEKDQQHFMVAVKMLRFCFYKMLENKGYITYKFLTDVPGFENYSWEQHSIYDTLREVEQMI